MIFQLAPEIAKLALAIFYNFKAHIKPEIDEVKSRAQKNDLT